MSTMSFGYEYNQGIRVGYDISVDNVTSFGGLHLSNVSSKDKGRIIREILERTGKKREDVCVTRVEDC